MANKSEAELLNNTDCCDEHSPKTYLGLCRMQQNLRPSFARSLFTNRQILTEQAYWDHMEDTAQTYYPEVMCDPCAKAPVMSVAEQFERRYAKPFTLKNRATVTCGEVKHQIMPGEGPDGESTWLQQFQRYMTNKTMLQSRGMDRFENDVAWQMLITQQINFPETEYLPDGLTISYPRHESLNHNTHEKFGKGQCNSLGIIEEWLNELACFNEDTQVTDVLMHWCTWNDLKQSDDFKECFKAYRPELFLGTELLNAANLEPVIRPRGVNRVYTDPNGIRYWTVNAKQKFCDESGAERQYDMFPKNELLALDLSGGELSYQPEFVYTPIMDVCAAMNEPEQINSARYAKTYLDCMNECWERRLTSNLMPILRCPNSSSRLRICQPKKAEAKVDAPKADTPVAPAPVASKKVASKKVASKAPTANGGTD